MAKILVLYYSAYGHIETMANAVAEGAREAGAQVEHWQQKGKGSLKLAQKRGRVHHEHRATHVLGIFMSSSPPLIM
jgi:multimeric flavodoxin WrbA